MDERSWPFSYPVTLVCHLATGGPLGFLTMPNESSEKEALIFSNEYEQCAKHNRALVVAKILEETGKKCEFLLAPIFGRDGSRGDQPVFGVFAMSMLMGHFVLSRVIRHERIPVVLDLDETLVKGHSIAQLEKKWEELKAKEQEIPEDPTDDEIVALNCDNLVYTDKLLLTRFRDEEEVKGPGQEIIKAKMVKGPYISSTQNSKINFVDRPCIELQDEGVYLSKILANQPRTSILLRPRPGWEEAYDSLVNSDADTVDRNKVSIVATICTTAERNYAHEVWRILDSKSLLISDRERACVAVLLSTVWATMLNCINSFIIYHSGQEKIVCVSEKKSLHKSFRYLEPNPLANPMPLALILDDKVDVWDQHARNQIYAIDPYDPYIVEYCDDLKAKKQIIDAVGIILQARDLFFKIVKDKLLTSFDDSQNSQEIDIRNLEKDYHRIIHEAPNMGKILSQVCGKSGKNQRMTNTTTAHPERVINQSIQDPIVASRQEKPQPIYNVKRLDTPQDPRKQRHNVATNPEHPSRDGLGAKKQSRPEAERKKSREWNRQSEKTAQPVRKPTRSLSPSRKKHRKEERREKRERDSEANGTQTHKSYAASQNRCLTEEIETLARRMHVKTEFRLRRSRDTWIATGSVKYPDSKPNIVGRGESRYHADAKVEAAEGVLRYLRRQALSETIAV